MRAILITPLLLLGILQAQAQAQVSAKTWWLYRGDGRLLDTDDERNEFFNTGNCSCEVPVKLEIELGGDLAQSGYEFQIVAGQGCLDSQNRISSNCLVLFGPTTPTANMAKRFFIKPGELTAKMFMEGNCSSGRNGIGFEVTLYTNKDKPANEWAASGEPLKYKVDTQVPSQVTNTSLKAGETQVTISFDAISSLPTGDAGASGDEGEIEGYQVLCEKADGQPAFTSPPDAGYDICVEPSGTTPDAGVTADGSAGTALPWPKPRAGDAGSDAGLDAKLADGTPKLEASTPDATPKLEAGTGREAGPADLGPQDSGGSSGSGAASGDTRYVCSTVQAGGSSIVVDKLENNVRYRFYIVTIDKARNPSAPLLVGEDSPQLAEDWWERYKRRGGTAEGGYCFVATAVHGSYNHPHVRVLRELRDRVLLPTEEGRLFVQLYYATGPVAASWIAGNGRARAATRALLWPVTVAAATHLYTDPWQKALVLLCLALGVGLLARRRRRRSR
jgi:hypothetical protein